MVASEFRTRVSTRRVYALGALAALLFGYDNGIIGAALLFIPNDLFLNSWEKGAVVSATVLGAMLGSLGSGPAADRLGRQQILLAAGVVFTIGALGAGAAMSVEGLVAFRFILGLAIGIASVTVPLYLAEMAQARDRGAVTSLNQYMIIVGTVASAGLGYALAFVHSWRWMLLAGVFPAVVLVAGMFAMPDTPRSLIRRGRAEDARAVLVGLRGDNEEAERELTEITTLDQQQRATRAFALLSAPWVRRLLVLGALLAIFQQITGINAIVYYGPTILKGFGVSETTALLFNFINGLVNIGTIALVVRSKVVDRRGRKPFLLAGLVGMSASLLVAGVAALILPANSTALFIIAAAAFVVITNTFSATWGPVLWVMLAEIYPLAIRAVAMAIATLFNWLAAFIIALTFPRFVEFAGIGSAFIVFAVIGVVLYPIVRWMVPETKERSLESLEKAFRNSRGIRFSEHTAADAGGAA